MAPIDENLPSDEGVMEVWAEASICPMQKTPWIDPLRRRAALLLSVAALVALYGGAETLQDF